MKKLLSAAVAALLICVCAACSPAEDPSSVPSSEDTTTAAAESTTAPTARPTARPTAEPTTKPTAAPTFPKTEIYTPVIAEINAAGPLYFQKSPSMKVDGTDNLYWYAMPYYNYDVMEPIGWSGMWAVRQNDKWGVIDVEGKIIVPAEFEYCYDCRSCGICLFYTPPEHGFIACRFNYDGELMTNSTDHGHGTDSAWWDITVNKSVFTSENGYQYYTFEHATIVSAIHV
ncbi:MAG: WG repeat-containing protein, partial [Oscillospiraceae bacterium]|nr:WG repeat-containing protein [Oscillospiraceae bacterium]